MDENEIIEYSDISVSDIQNNVEMQETVEAIEVTDVENDNVEVSDIQSDVEMQETVEVIEVVEGDSYDVEVSEAFPASEGEDYYNHALLNNRELHDQHPITAITGLRKELDRIQSLQTVYSDHMGVANYYKWNEGAYDDTGYFVSVVPNTDTIKICDGADILGVVVDEAAFIGGQDGVTLDYVEDIVETHGASRNNEYGLVVTSGLVDVRCELDVEAGDYVVSNTHGYATKSSSPYGYKVVATENKQGTNYAVIALGVQGDVTNALGAVTQELDERLDAAEANIVSAINVANQAYNKAVEIGEANNVMSDKVDGALSEVDKIASDVTNMGAQASQAAKVSAQAKAIAEGAVASAAEWRQEAIDSANDALTETSQLRDEFKQKADEVDGDLSDAIQEIETLKEDLEPLATWPEYIEVPTLTSEHQIGVIYYFWSDTVNQAYYEYYDESALKWIGSTKFGNTNANKSQIYYVPEIALYWYYKDGEWKSTNNIEEAGITSYAGFVARADEDSATLASIVEWKGSTGESMAAFMQEAKDDHATVSAIASYKRTDTDDTATEGAAGLIAQVNANKASVELIAEFDGGIAGLKAQVGDNTAQLSHIVSHTYKDARGLAAIDQQVDAHESSITSLTTWQGTTNSSLASIRQKADANGASIRLTTSNLGMYSVGPRSQADGFTLDQAKNVLEEGMIYVPTTTHDETYEGAATRTFATKYYYKWDGAQWTTSSSCAVKFSDEYVTGDDNAPYWYIPGSSNVSWDGETYYSHTLYKWQQKDADEKDTSEYQWVIVATLAGNFSNRAVSQIRQDANEIVAEVTNAYGAVAGFGAKLSETEAKVNSIASWPTGEGTHNMAIFEQVAPEDGDPYIALAAVRNVEGSDTPKVDTLAGAKIVLSDSEELGSYINLDADHINLDTSEFTVQDANNATLLRAGNGSVNIVDFTVGRIGGSSCLYCNQPNYLGTSDTDIGYTAGGAGVYLGTDGIGLGGGNFYVRDDGYLYSTSGLIGGWAIQSGRLYSGAVGLISNNTANGVRIYAGSTTPTAAPFRVNVKGYLYSTYGEIGGWHIQSGLLSSGKVGLSSSGTTDDSIRIYAGSTTASSAPFRVTNGGHLYSTYGEIGGWSIGKNSLSNQMVMLSTAGPDVTSLISDTSPCCISAGLPVYTHTSDTIYNVNSNGFTYSFSAVTSDVTMVQLGSSTNAQGEGQVILDSWTISGTQITLNAHIIYNDSGYDVDNVILEIMYGPASFMVLEDGSLYANAAHISGTVYADEGSFKGEIIARSGHIGGLSIQESEISSESSSLTFTADGLVCAEQLYVAEKCTARLMKAAQVGGRYENSPYIYFEDGISGFRDVSVSVDSWDVIEYGSYDFWHGGLTPGQVKVTIKSNFPMAEDRQFVVYGLYSDEDEGESGSNSATVTMSQGAYEAEVILPQLKYWSYYPSGGGLTRSCVGSFVSATVSPDTIQQPSSNLRPVISFSTSLVPIDTNVSALGRSNKVWSELYVATAYIGKGYLGTSYNDTGSVIASDINKKNTICNIDDKYATLFDNLRPVTFKLNEGTSGRTHIGLIAQEVKASAESLNIDMQDLAAYCSWQDQDGRETCGIRYEELIALNIDQIQKLKKRVAELENKLDTLQNDLGS